MPILLKLMLFFLIAMQEVLSRPSSEFPDDSGVGDRCRAGDIYFLEVCQRCAKQTKSNIVYPMCCNNEEDVFIWCDRYINYGRKPKRGVVFKNVPASK